MSEHNFTKENLCPNCGQIWKPADRQDHCPNCLCGIHHEDDDGEICGGTLEPVSVWIQEDGAWEILQRCRLCGHMTATPMTHKDSRIKVLSIASKPLSTPPFPVKKIRELTRIMGGQGDIEQE